MECPSHGQMELRTMDKEVEFRGKKIQFTAQHFLCPECGIEVDDLNLAAINQKSLSDAYRKAENLLTGEQIVERRKELNRTQPSDFQSKHNCEISD